MPFIHQLFECTECGAVLETDEERKLLLPCGQCGATTSKPITDLKETFALKVKPANASGAPDLTVKIADDLYKKTNEWRQLKMSIDKKNDIYEKTVINPETDEVLYYNREPLSHHTGRGSAKRITNGTSGKDK